jgi:hypothetical protein
MAIWILESFEIDTNRVSKATTDQSKYIPPMRATESLEKMVVSYDNTNQ